MLDTFSSLFVGLQDSCFWFGFGLHNFGLVCWIWLASFFPEDNASFHKETTGSALLAGGYLAIGSTPTKITAELERKALKRHHIPWKRGLLKCMQCMPAGHQEPWPSVPHALCREPEGQCCGLHKSKSWVYVPRTCLTLVLIAKDSPYFHQRGPKRVLARWCESTTQQELFIFHIKPTAPNIYIYIVYLTLQIDLETTRSPFPPKLNALCPPTT